MRFLKQNLRMGNGMLTRMDSLSESVRHRRLVPLVRLACLGWIVLAATVSPTVGQEGELPADYAQKDAIQRAKSEPHEEMKRRVGKWNVSLRFAEKFGGGAETGECSMKLILDGKFVVSEGSLTMMGATSKTFGVYGYDSLTKEYTVYNLNSGYTAAYEMRGKKREDGVINYHGIMKDAASVEGRPYRAEEKTLSPDKFEIVIYDGTGKDEFHVMTMTYERAK